MEDAWAALHEAATPSRSGASSWSPVNYATQQGSEARAGGGVRGPVRHEQLGSGLP